jgi:hypothetical protein
MSAPVIPAGALFAAHHAHREAFARHAARHALVVALQTETSPGEALTFFDWLLDDSLRRFTGSFVDLWGFDEPFREAAIKTMPGRPRGSSQ